MLESVLYNPHHCFLRTDSYSYLVGLERHPSQLADTYPADLVLRAMARQTQISCGAVLLPGYHSICLRLDSATGKVVDR